MLEYLSLSFIAFAAAELVKKVKVHFAGREIKIKRPKLAWSMLIVSLAVSSFGLFAFSLGLVAHSILRMQETF